MAVTISEAELTPTRIVAELDKYIVGQADAKKAVALALRNRWRRLQLPPEEAREIIPKNILMIGPTGVGKTEIARRLAALVHAPFIKVEATKYTEVGYVGRDVESMIRELLELAVRMVRARQLEAVQAQAAELAEQRLVDLLLPPEETPPADAATAQRRQRSRAKIKSQLATGAFDDRLLEVPVEEKPPLPAMVGMIGTEPSDGGAGFSDFLEKIIPTRVVTRKVKTPEARRLLAAAEAEKLIDEQAVIRQAIELTEQRGIVFIDEIDKIVAGEGRAGPDVSRQGVQRDLLPLVEGSTVNSRHGAVQTNHILFIAAGAFHSSKPADLMPEFQGRFPIRVELSDLNAADYARILREPRHSLLHQQEKLLCTEGLQVQFTDDAVAALAGYAHSINQATVNIGARRLHTLLEKVIEDLSFDAPARRGERHVIDAVMVRTKLAALAADEDVSRYVL